MLKAVPFAFSIAPTSTSRQVGPFVASFPSFHTFSCSLKLVMCIIVIFVHKNDQTNKRLVSVCANKRNIPGIMSSVRYRQVPQQEPIEPSETEKKRKAERVERITVKIHAFIWVVLAFALAYFTDVIALLQDPEKTNRYCGNCGRHKVLGMRY